MYMRQFMQISVALMMLVPSAAIASGVKHDGFLAGDSVKVEEKAVAAVEMRTITGTVYDAATNIPMAGVRVQATGHKKITTMTNAEGKFTLSVPEYATLLSFSTQEYLLVQRPIGNSDIINVRLYSDKFQDNYSDDMLVTADKDYRPGTTTAFTIDEDIQNKLGADVRTINRSGTTGMGAVMFIRGLNSINANTQPLFVVDGVIWDIDRKSVV